MERDSLTYVFFLPGVTNRWSGLNREQETLYESPHSLLEGRRQRQTVRSVVAAIPRFTTSSLIVPPRSSVLSEFSGTTSIHRDRESEVRTVGYTRWHESVEKSG